MSTTGTETVATTRCTATGERVRVLHVIDSLHLGGAERLLVTLATHIDADRFDLRVCSLSPDDVESPIAVALLSRGVPVSRAARLRRHDPGHVPWLMRQLRLQGIDLVHTHLAYGNVIGQLAAAVSRRPAVATIHSARDRHRNLPALKQSLQRMAIGNAEIVVACSPGVAVSVRERFWIRASRLVVLPNGIDCETYSTFDRNAARVRRAEFLGGQAGPLVVAVGTVSSVKRHEQLVEATARLVDRFPGIRLVIVGRDGDNAALVRERIASLGLEEHVLLAGESTDVATTLAAADLFVNASQREGLPLAILEAMAVGVPVVTTTLGGIASSVDKRPTARVVPPGGPVAIAEAIAELLRDADAARQTAVRARAYVRTNHSARAWTAALEDIYAQLTSSRPTPA